MKAITETTRRNSGSSPKKQNTTLKRILLILVIFVLVLVIGAIAFFVSMPFIVESKVQKQLDSLVTKEATLTSEVLMSKLESSSELVTSKMNMVGVVEYDDAGVPVLSKGDFVMIYKATVKAGIDVKKVQFAIDDQSRIVYIYVPDAQVLDVKVLPDSVKYYNKGYALFNNDSHEDAVKAQQQAEDDAKKEALETGIIDVADSQSETLVKGILSSVTDGYEMKFVRSEASLKAKAEEIEKNKPQPSTADN